MPAQFRAEDGAVFYQGAYPEGFGAVFHSHAGSFHTVHRLVAACTVYFPLACGPLLFNGAAFVVQFLPVLLPAPPGTDRLFSDPPHKYIFAFLYLACPLNCETYLSLTNIPWYLPAVGVAVPAGRPGPRSGNPAAGLPAADLK